MDRTEPERNTGAPDEAPVDIVGRHTRLVARTALISGFTVLSRVLGYGREALTAGMFGATSAVLDAFVTAWRVPNLFRRLLGEGAVSASLQNALTQLDADQGESAGRELMWDTLRLAFWILLAVCALVMGCVSVMGDVMPWTGWQWLGRDPAAMRVLTFDVTPYVVVICLAGLIGGALSVRGRFVAASAGPGVMNVIAIVTLVAIGLKFGWSGPGPEDGPAGRLRHLAMARWFSWGLVGSGFAQLAMLVPEMRAAGLLSRVRVVGRHGAQAFDVLKRSLPLALGAAVYQVNVLVDSFMANNMLSAGGASTYYFANRIQQLPLAIVATAATSAVFPALQALAHKREFGELRRLHERTHLGIAFIALPASVGLFVLATPVTACLLQYGKFTPEGVARTASAIRMLCLALVPAGAIGLLSRAYYALGDFRTPVRISVFALLLNVVLNTLFVVGFELDTAGLGLATAIVSWGNVALLLPGLLRRIRERAGAAVAGLPDLGPRLAKMTLAAGACGASAWSCWWALGSATRSWAVLMAAITCGVVGYVIAAELFRLPEWAATRARIADRLSRRA